MNSSEITLPMKSEVAKRVPKDRRLYQTRKGGLSFKTATAGNRFCKSAVEEARKRGYFGGNGLSENWFVD